MRSIKFNLLIGASIAILCAPIAYAANNSGKPNSKDSNKAKNHEIAEIVVTAERRSENIQNAPVSMSAFTKKSLRNQRIELPQNMASVVPNMAFQPGNYGRPNFIIRGIGYQIVTVTGDPGVVLDVNDNPATASRIAKAGFLDVQRIEVLRGPQGTLYGRNATGGVVNIITNKPNFNGFSGSVTGEVGNYNLRRMKGYINVPVNDQLAFRVAATTLQRTGFITNIYNNQKVDGRNFSEGRVSVRYRPTDNFTADLMYDGFRENDNSGDLAANGFSICERDPGPTSVGGVSLTDGNPQNTAIRDYLSFGCQTRNNNNTAPDLSIYNPAMRSGIGNAVGDLGGRIAAAFGLANGDIRANNTGITNAYDTMDSVEPYDRDKNNLVQLRLAYSFDNGLDLVSQSTFNNDHLTNYAGGTISNDFFNTPPFAPVALTVPQILNGNPIAQEAAYTYNNLYAREYTEELRLISHFTGPINFSAGLYYDKLMRRDAVFILDTSIIYASTVLGPYGLGGAFPIDPNPLGDNAGGGHYYYESLNPYYLTSDAAFADMTWDVTDNVTVRLGFRWTHDKKVFLNNDSAANLLVPGFGIQYGAPLVAKYNEPTGRLNIEWRPNLPFTDSTMFYALYSRGYKGGGFNPPNINAVSAPPVPIQYSPEFVNDYEIGTKNTLLDNTLVLNMDLFDYNYQNYQFTRQVLLGVATANINAKIYGLELQSQWQPTDNLAFNLQLGALKTRIEAGANANSIDYFNLTQGVPGYFALHDFTSACIVNTAALGNVIGLIKAGAVPAAFLANGCPADIGADPFGLQTGIPLQDKAGVPVDVAGNRLPSVPSWTGAFGVQYTFPMQDGWTVVPRLDYRYTGDQYSDLFNDPENRVHGFGTFNATVMFADNSGLSAQLFAENLGSRGDITGASGGGTVTGSARTGNYIDPPTFGLSIQKTF